MNITSLPTLTSSFLGIKYGVASKDELMYYNGCWNTAQLRVYAMLMVAGMVQTATRNKILPVIHQAKKMIFVWSTRVRDSITKLHLVTDHRAVDVTYTGKYILLYINLIIKQFMNFTCDKLTISWSYLPTFQHCPSLELKCSIHLSGKGTSKAQTAKQTFYATKC